MTANSRLGDRETPDVSERTDRRIATAPFQNILVPMDRDVIGREGLERTVSIVQCCMATVHVLYVRWDPAFGVYKRDRLRYDPDEDLKRMGERFKREMTERGLEVLIEHRQGIPHREILTYVNKNDIDLVIMTTHGRTGLNRFLQGSVTQRVINESPVPVMVVKQMGAKAQAVETSAN